MSRCRPTSPEPVWPVQSPRSCRRGSDSCWGLDEALEEFRRQNSPGGSGTGPAAAGDRDGSSPSSSLPAQGAPTGSRLAPDPHRAASRDGEPGPSPAVKTEAIDTAVESQWGEDAQPSGSVPTAFDPPRYEGKARAGSEHSGQKVPHRPGGHSQDHPPEPPLRKGGRIGATSRRVLPSVPEPGKDRPGLVSTSWIVAAFATRWVQLHRWPPSSRPGWSGGMGNPVRRRRVVIE